MPRVARIVLPDVPHHVTQKGNNGQDVFFTDDDRRKYLSILFAQADRYGLAVAGYCLMSNHVHVVGVPRKEQSLARAIGRTDFIYAQHVNRTYGRSGHLWQNRFYSCALEERHFFAALRYVEMNPVRAGIVRTAWRYRWSTARVHCALRRGEGRIDLDRWKKGFDASEWKEFLTAGEEGIDGLRRHTRTGRPLGSDEFLCKAEKVLGRRVRLLPIGRPRKAGRSRAERAPKKRKSRKSR